MSEQQPPASDHRHTAVDPQKLRRLGWWVLAIVLLLVLLPEGLRLALIQAAPRLGLGQAQIEDVDLNLFKGSVGIDGLQLTRDDETKLILKAVAADISWLKLVVGQIHIESASIDGLQVVARQMPDGQWEVVIPLISEPGDDAAEVDTPETDAGGLPKVLLSHLQIANTQLSVESEFVEGDFVIDSLSLEHVSTWLQAPLVMELKGSWRQAPVVVLVTAEPWAETPKVVAEIVLQSLPLAGINALPDITLQGDVTAGLNATVQLLPSGIDAAIDGQLSLDDIALDYQGLALKQQHAGWQGQVAALVPTVEEAELTYQLQGEVISAGLELRDLPQQVRLVAWEELALGGLSLDEQLNLDLQQLKLTAAALMDDHLKTGELLIDQVQLQEANALRIETVQLNRGDYSVVLDKQGQLRAESILAGLNKRFAGAPAAQPETSPEAAPVVDQHEAEATAAPLLFSLQKLTVGEETQISLVDQRFAEPFKLHVVIADLVVNQLDQFNPEQATTVSLKGRFGEFSRLTVDGQGQFFADPIATSIKGELKGMELPDLSPYSAAYLGYELTRGHYDHQFSVDIANQEIDLKNTLYLRQLDLESVDPNTPQPLEQQLDVPLGIALDMLRDGNDNIELEVPIHGRLDKPNIRVNDIINDALATALKNGATGYLAYALQPYGAILMAAEMVGDQVNAIRLEPMTYAPGQAEVPEQRDYLDKIRSLLEARPKLHLSLCGRSNGLDRSALFAEAKPATASTEGEKTTAPAITDEQRKTLLKLAQQRAKNLKRLFVNEGLEGERVLLCQAQYKEKGVNGVQLAM